VARDATHICFYAQTRQLLTPRTDPNWMWLLVDADQDPHTGWEGYDFLLNRTMEGDDTWLERNAGGCNWQRVEKVALVAHSNTLMVAVPRKALGLPDGESVRFDFKWWDNSQKPGDIMDMYLSGDAAPDARFRFRYQTPPSGGR
jgi:hypothetical protein